MEMQSFDVQGRKIGDGAPTFIIAEVGINHDGDVAKAHRLVDAAADAGADAVKFQTYATDSFVVPGNPLYETFKKNQLSAADDLRSLQKRAERKGILFFSSATDFYGLETLIALGVPLHKLSSANLTNLPLMRKVAATGKPVIISSGGATLAEVIIAHDTLIEAGAGGVAVLKCTSLYPCPAANVNLAAIATLRAAIPAPIGYSDHSDGITAAVAAVALGARLLEKHFTESKMDAGHDHHFSADAAELAALVKAVREVEQMIGSSELRPVGDELTFRREARRVLTALTDIAPGATIEERMIGLRRPAEAPGLAPDLMARVIGRPARRAIRAGQSIHWDDI